MLYKTRNAKVIALSAAVSWAGALITQLVLASCAVAAPGPSSWGIEPGGTVTAIACSRDVVYIGGAFRSVGPLTGGGVPVNRASGKPEARFPQVAGYPWVSICDGKGGWYIGGAFSAVGGKPHANLAHILPDGSVDDWGADADGLVFTLTLQGRTLYVGGGFTRIAGQDRHALAALDISSRVVEAWHPNPNGAVRVMILRDHKLYVGGDFTAFDGQDRHHLASVDIAACLDDEVKPVSPSTVERRRREVTPKLTSWNPSVDYPEDPPAYVWSLVSDERSVFVGGSFSRVSGHTRSCIAAIDPDSGTTQPWDPQIRLEYNPYYYVPLVRAMAIHAHRLYVGGHFSEVDGVARNALAAIDTRTGALERWNPKLVDVLPYAEVNAIGVNDGVVYVGGEFLTANGVTRENAASFDAEDDALTEWRPRPNNHVFALGLGEKAVYMGGPFSSVWNWERRAGLAALDRETGELLPWNPGVAGVSVNAVAVSDSVVYVGGGFWAVGGEARDGIAAVDAKSGAVTRWDPGCDGWVQALLIDGATLYVGGLFSQFGGQPRGNLAAVDRETAAIREWRPEADDLVSSLAVGGSTLFVGGWFRRVGGQVRYGLAAVDTATGTVSPWNPAADDVVDAIALNGGRLYVGGGFRTLGALPRSGLGAIDVRSGAVTDWNPSPGGSFSTTVYALAASGSTVYVGGNFGSINGEPRGFLAGVDASTGIADPSMPDADGAVWSLSTSGGELFAGGSFEAVGGLPHCGLVVLPVGVKEARVAGISGGSDDRIALAVFPNPTRGGATLRYSLPGRAPVTVTVYDLQGRVVAKVADHQVQEAGPHDLPLRSNGWRSGYYFCRFEAGGAVASRKLFVVK